MQYCCYLRKERYVEVKFRLSDCNLWVDLAFFTLCYQLRLDKNMLTVHSLSCIISIDFSEVLTLLRSVEGILAVPSDVVRCRYIKAGVGFQFLVHCAGRYCQS